jgi:hypothetical protein
MTFSASNIIFANSETIPPQMQKLTSKLLGQWKADLVMKVDGKEIKMKDFCDFSQIADGMGLYMTETSTMDNGAEYKSVNIVGYDASGEVIHWYTVSNMGETHDHILKWIDENSFTLTYSSMANNKNYVEMIECRFLRDGYCEFKQNVKVNNVTTQEISGTFIRQ